MNIQYPVYKPALNGNEKRYVNECLESSWISSQGKFVQKFEDAFAKYLGVESALTCTNGTVALHLALLALGIGEGDEVIVPSFTYVASANAIHYVGAKPIFIDSEATYFQMDSNRIEASITSKTKAILAVHLYGHACDMKKIVALAKQYNLFIIEDCAEALGTMFEGQYVGTFGDVATFSFFGNKTITTGEGGMVVTNHSELAEKVFKLKGQGVSKTERYFHEIIGYNYRMTNICCAIGLAQLERVDLILEKKIAIAQQYQENLNSTKGIFCHEQQVNTKNTYWLFSILLSEKFSRDKLMQYLLKNGIDSRPFFTPMHKLPIYSSKLALPIAEMLGQQGLNLPSYPDLTENDISYISNKIKEYIIYEDTGSYHS